MTDERRDDPVAAPWAAPEVGLDVPHRAPRSITSVERPVATPAGATPRPVPLRPMTASDILDGAFAVLKAQPAKIAVITATFVVPLQLLDAWLQRDVFGGVGLIELFGTDDPSVIDAADDTSSSPAGGYGLMLLSSLMLTFVAAAITHLVTGWYAGVDRSARDVLGMTMRRTWPLLAAWVLVHLAELGGAIACLVPGVLVMAGFAVTTPAVAAERLGPVVGMRRAWRLARRRFWPTVGITLLVGIVAGLVGNALSAAPVLVAFAVGLKWGWILLAAAGIVSSLVTMPVVAASATLLYLDLRIRTEGLDLQLEADARFR
jgi:hypothetical protein